MIFQPSKTIIKLKNKIFLISQLLIFLISQLFLSFFFRRVAIFFIYIQQGSNFFIYIQKILTNILPKLILNKIIFFKKAGAKSKTKPTPSKAIFFKEAELRVKLNQAEAY